jgi:hypothetical protein
MSLGRRTALSLLASAALSLGLTSGALASGGSGSGSGGGSGGGGGSSVLCGSITLDPKQSITSYYTYFHGTVTNCGTSTTRYTVDVVDTTVHANRACQLAAAVSGRPASLAPGTVSYVRFMGPLPCYDTYALQVQLTEDQQVVASVPITLENTPTGVILR